jgi:hypothetical protein
MPSTFNGVGTKFCGRRDEGADGSYVTTEFFVVGNIPLVPLRSWRVRPSGPLAHEHWPLGRAKWLESCVAQPFLIGLWLVTSLPERPSPQRPFSYRLGRAVLG